MKTIQEMLQELSQCIVTVSGEFRFRTNWNGGKVPQPEPEKPDLDTFDPNVPFCIENVGDVPASVQYNTKNTNIRISKNYKNWNDYTSGTEIELKPKDRVYIKSDYVKDLGTSPRFVFNGDGARLRARGNIASLIYGSNDAYVNKYTSTEEYCYCALFSRCTSLNQAPELPATKLVNSCYSSMFDGCTGLTQVPALPATKLVNSCYSSMFDGCMSLTQAPALPATTLTDYCYYNMFSGCASLTQAPELPATTLAFRCCSYMFQGCSSLTQAPELPATTLADYCYYHMFDGCTSLTQAPELPATTLANRCCSYMFSRCTSLTQAPALPAATLTKECYYSMFSGCTSLNYIKCLATDASATNCTKDWLSNVSATGTFECDNKQYFTLDSPNGIPSGWTITEINPAQPEPEPEKPDLDTFDPNVPFCIENIGDVQAGVQYNTKNTNIKISKDYKTWNDYTTGDSIALDPTERVYIKSDLVVDIFGNPRFIFNGDGARLRARGNIASLIYGTDDAYVNKYTSVTKYCYNALFKNCKSLVQVPELPATTLAEWCYYDMFRNCTSLTQAPELPATTLVGYCYYNMFYNCTSLTQAPELPAITLTSNCYNAMFYGCTSLTQAPELPATTLADSCYKFMFDGCTNLTQAPELPTATLADGCYYSMFQYCKKLNYVKCLATDTSATDCTKNWLSNVAQTGTFECDNKKYFTLDSPNGIPVGWSTTEINPDPPTPPVPEKPDLDTFDPNIPFCIENVGDVPVEIGMYNYTEAVRTNCEISYDLQSWQNYSLPITQDANSTTISKITLTNKGDRVYIKADLVANPGTFSKITVFNKSNTKKIRARGNIASLNKGTNDAYKTDYLTADSYCYANLFSACGLSLTQAPELPATTLASNCYDGMFWDCTSLTQAPELPATKLAYMCYSNMFRACASLTQAPELPATKLANYCYNSMFRGCTNLTHAPELPATTLPIVCYQRMFQDCTKLNYVKCLATDISAANCTASWLEGVATTGDFYAPASTRWTTNSYSGIPSGWTRHDIT